MFRKIIISLFMSLMTMFFIWTIIGFQKYGDDLINHHLNFYAMFTRFKGEFNRTNGYDFLDDIQNIKHMTEFFNKLSILNWFQTTLENTFNFEIAPNNDFFKFVVGFVNALIDPIISSLYLSALLVYITGSATILCMSIIDVISCILNFIFFPLFV